MKCFLCLVKRDNVQKMVNGEISFFEEARGVLFCDDRKQHYSYNRAGYKWLVDEAKNAARFLKTDVVAFLLVVPDDVSELTREVFLKNIDTLKILVDVKAETGEFLNEEVVTKLQNWLSQGNSFRSNPESLRIAEMVIGRFTGYAELINNPPILNAYNVSNERRGSEQEDETFEFEHANKVHKVKYK